MFIIRLHKPVHWMHLSPLGYDQAMNSLFLHGQQAVNAVDQQGL